MPKNFYVLCFALVAVMALSYIAIGYLILSNDEIAKDGRESHFALCAFQHDLETRVVKEKDYLKLSTGPTHDLLLALANSQQNTINIIKPRLHCP